MTNPIELPSGKLLDLDRFIALVPNDSENETESELILEGYPQPIYLESKDVFVVKEKLNQNLTNDLSQWDKEEQRRKNQPLISLIEKWLRQKKDTVSTPEDEQEYKEIQAELLKSRIG